MMRRDSPFNIMSEQEEPQLPIAPPDITMDLPQVTGSEEPIDVK